jgi:class 3 adenylate cyclase
VAPLDTAGRAKLPNNAFAYVDSQGRRRLPIHDEAHVRNALARFNQVGFEDDEARDRALQRVLRAAKKYRIVPVGFINAQLRSERQAAGGRADGVLLPSGFVTMLMTDIEGSTALLDRLGDGYRDVLDAVRSVLRSHIEEASGYVVEIRADEVFAVFAEPLTAVDAAVGAQRELAERSWPDGLTVRVRVGIHSGYPTLVEANYLGMAVHTTARICNAAHGGQTVASGDTKLALKGTSLNGVRFQSLGIHRLRGIPDDVHLHQLEAKGLGRRFPPVRTARGPL